MTLLAWLPRTCWKSGCPATGKSRRTWCTFFRSRKICAVSVRAGRTGELSVCNCSIRTVISFFAWICGRILSSSRTGETGRAGLAIQNMSGSSVWIVGAWSTWQRCNWSLSASPVWTVMTNRTINALWCINKACLTRICAKRTCKPRPFSSSNGTKIARGTWVCKTGTSSGAVKSLGANYTSIWLWCFSCVWSVCSSRAWEFIRIFCRFGAVVTRGAGWRVIINDTRSSAVITRWTFETIRWRFWTGE